MKTFHGLTSEEALQRLATYGLNAIREEKGNPFFDFLRKFWDPVPWMLEVIILLEMVLGKWTESGIIGILLFFNATLSFFQESRAKTALALLKKRLAIKTRVLRDGTWALVPAEEVVPEDIICLRMGDMVPADAQVLEGVISIDSSAITGESLPKETIVGDVVYAGSMVKHGEAYACVVSTGKNTFFGKTAEIMRITKTPSHFQATIFSIVKYLVAFDLALILSVGVYSLYLGISILDIIPFSLLLLIASVPVALPATYTLSTALGAMELASEGILVTRLSAIEEAASMNILCVDKTGTITTNVLQVSRLHPYHPYTEGDLLNLASLACEEATQDAIDLAILRAAKGASSNYLLSKRIQFIPFDPNRKCSEAIIQYQGQNLRVLKGAPSILMHRISASDDMTKDWEKLSSDGSRILVVICGSENSFDLVGFIALQDPPRETSYKTINQVQDLGVSVKMITGDGLATALSIAKQVGIGLVAVSMDTDKGLTSEEMIGSDVISNVFPEDKFQVIQFLQSKGNICGVTGDGVNDAPALKRAEVGIAMSNATDVAKAAASLALTNPGLVDVVEAIKSSRRIYQRLLTYTLNKIIKTLEISVLLGVGLLVTGNFIISPLLIVLLLFANDFVTMSISTDRVSFSQKPDVWDIQKLMLVGGSFAFFLLGMSFFLLLVGQNLLHLSIEEVRTWIFLILVFTGQMTVYLVRERKHFWHSMPSYWMIVCFLLDLGIVSIMAIKGFLMAPISGLLILGLFAVTALYFIFLDFFKIKIFNFFDLSMKSKVDIFSRY
jgi:H+-transporting ATPase